MELKPKTPIKKTLGDDFAAPFNQLLPPTPLSNGQPAGVIQHAGLTKREYFAAQFLSAYISSLPQPGFDAEILTECTKLTDLFIEALNK